MGASNSTSNAPPRRALHVLRVAPGSPAADTDISPFFDFLVGIKGLETVDLDLASLERVIEGREGRELELIVWSSKVSQMRVVKLTPTRKWSSALPPPPDAKPSLLGLSMRLCNPEQALENVWHILDVHEGSPAESAGLVPYGDYIIGFSGGVLERESDFYELCWCRIGCGEDKDCWDVELGKLSGFYASRLDLMPEVDMGCYTVYQKTDLALCLLKERKNQKKPSCLFLLGMRVDHGTVIDRRINTDRRTTTTDITSMMTGTDIRTMTDTGIRMAMDTGTRTTTHMGTRMMMDMGIRMIRDTDTRMIPIHTLRPRTNCFGCTNFWVQERGQGFMTGRGKVDWLSRFDGIAIISARTCLCFPERNAEARIHPTDRG
ncbi:GRASP55/65 family domain-containing protein [Rhizoctonia solani AG-1 IA]|uniref:GRASP55/65 family domain-containing protein n=1 Tax=Thanatephorus cucumeris (strain AG1-IA) TaxID=983506 RepID=L8X6H7_THACA|nr:GRASP55/65 family domain-containing protein [Rhizoctonia solani AG-1 IA]